MVVLGDLLMFLSHVKALKFMLLLQSVTALLEISSPSSCPRPHFRYLWRRIVAKCQIDG